jgi:thiol-disulfide isomerase/thioredoxin
MKTRAVLIVAIVAAALGAVGGLLVSGPGPLWRTALGQRVLHITADASAPSPPPGVAVAAPGDAMPVLRLSALGGEPVELPAAYAGRPLLINYWASWCAPCVEEMPELQRYSHSQRGAGVQVIGIALDEPDAVRTFLDRVPVAYPILIERPGPGDSSVRLGNRRGVLPYSVLIDADGRILRQRIGPFAPGELPAFVADAMR